jgi:hypothetical protein
MISLALIFFAAFFNSVMDACENEPNYNESIFKKLPHQFWLKEQSWKYVKKIFGYRPDAWHLSKSAMIICFVLAIIFFDIPIKKWQDVAVCIIAGGLTWNFTFWLFYNKIFGVK